ncbi:MAG: DUF1489 domain-containing protein [Pseudomonadota bacterium]
MSKRANLGKPVGRAEAAEGLNLVKLCVGAETPRDLAAWQTARAAERAARGVDPRPRHTTRMRPTREAELLAGGSLYWVFRGVIRARQVLAAIEPVDGPDGIRRYDLVLEPKLIATEPHPRRAFQGWRYLTAEDAPRDLLRGYDGPVIDLPDRLAATVAEYGVL